MNASNIVKALFFSSLVTMTVLGCSKESENNGRAPEITDLSGSSLIQVYVATVSATRNYVYVDANGITGAALSLGSLFPSTGHASSIAPGIRNFLVRDTLGTSLQVPLNFAVNLSPAARYTIFMYDSTNAPKHKIVPTTITIPHDTTARIRFANFIFSPTAVPAVDVFSKRRGVNLFTNINTTEVTDFIPMPSAFNDTIYVREAGTTNLLAQLIGLNPTQKRSYTLVFRGRYQVTSGTIARTLSSFVNY